MAGKTRRAATAGAWARRRRPWPPGARRGAAARRSPAEDAWALVVHLRLPFQLLLAPVFLWGWLLAGAGLTPRIALPFLAFHLFLYGGATAYNSAYDRDEGPVGGLEHPPPVPPSLLPFALLAKALGWLLAALVNVPFFLAYGLFLLLSIAYSHPRIRLKARPLPSLLVVGLGQGTLAFLAAWAAASGEVTAAWSGRGLGGAVAATLLILGVYPLTQIYQVEEDARRGDRTVAVAWGAAGAFRLAAVCTLLGGAVFVAVLLHMFGPLSAALAAAGLGLQVAAVSRWASRFDPSDVRGNYRRAMRLNGLGAAALWALLGWHIVVSGRWPVAGGQ